MRPDQLKPKYEIFVNEWVIHRNASRAAVAAGYAIASANVEGCRLMQKPEIRAAIKAKLAKQRQAMNGRLTASGLNKERWLKEVMALAFTKATDFATLTNEFTETIEGEGRDARTVVTVNPKVTIVDSEMWSEQMKRAVKKINADGSVELYDKKQSLELIGKAMDWIEDKQIIPSNVKVNITIPANGREIPPPKKNE